jgi:hypothetical protein
MTRQTGKRGKISRSEGPLNLEMPFEKLDEFNKPTKSFYVRTHFPIPKIEKTNGDCGLRVKSISRSKFDRSQRVNDHRPAFPANNRRHADPSRVASREFPAHLRD